MNMQLVIVGLLGAMAAILANSGIAVFNDGLRPILPEFLEGRINKRELAATSFAISFGLVIGFGIPVSIGASIILVHSLLLMTDIIGAWTPDGKKGMIIAGVIGAIYGIGLTLGLEFIVEAFNYLPINFLDALGAVGAPIVVAFAVFPAVAVANQHGFKQGGITFLATMLALFLVKRFGRFTINENATITISAEGIALLVGMIFMIYFAVRIKGNSTENQDLLGVFAERVKRIRKYSVVLALTGGLVAAATSLSVIGGDPISLNLMANGQFNEAALAAFARAIGFIPLVFSTAIVTGVYSPAGATFVYVAGLLLHGQPILAFIVGTGIMFVEILLLNSAAKTLDKYPGVRDMGEHIRTAMNRVLELALLVGGAVASEQIAPGIGYFWVFGAYLLNKQSNKPIVDMAVGPVAAIALGIIVNILYVIGLYVPAG